MGRSIPLQLEQRQNRCKHTGCSSCHQDGTAAGRALAEGGAGAGGHPAAARQSLGDPGHGGGAAGLLLAFPAQFRGTASSGNTGYRQRATATAGKIRLHRPAGEGTCLGAT